MALCWPVVGRSACLPCWRRSAPCWPLLAVVESPKFGGRLCCWSAGGRPLLVGGRLLIVYPVGPLLAVYPVGPCWPCCLLLVGKSSPERQGVSEVRQGVSGGRRGGRLFVGPVGRLLLVGPVYPVGLFTLLALLAVVGRQGGSGARQGVSGRPPVVGRRSAARGGRSVVSDRLIYILYRLKLSRGLFTRGKRGSNSFFKIFLFFFLFPIDFFFICSILLFVGFDQQRFFTICKPRFRFSAPRR